MWKKSGLACLILAGNAVWAADSVSNTSCLPGDATSPWDTAAQQHRYVVDLADLTTSWGTTFGIAPIIKSSKSNTGFFGSLTSTQALSRNVQGPQALTGSYKLWNGPGFGIHPTNNTAPPSEIDITGRTGVQFAAAVAEFSTTDDLQNYNAVLSAIVQVDPAEPARLFVTRTVAAVNSCDSLSNLAQIGMGTIDSAGHLIFRADNFGTAANCAAVPVADVNIYRVDTAARNPAALNVISGTFPGTFDATDRLIVGTTVAHNTPTMAPSSVMGGDGLYIGTNFNNQYVRGFSSPVSGDLTHLAPGVTEQRGNPSYSINNCANIGSTHGVAAILARTATLVNAINIWGINSTGGVTGKKSLVLPAVITDPTTGATNIGGDNEFDHYHSQVAFRGGNGQIALGQDSSGRLMAAAQVSHPLDAGPDWPVNMIPVARMDCATGTVEWTLAAYNDGSVGEFGTGKPILDGPGGNVIGRMVTLDNVTGGTPFGPSVSAPMFDSAGNLWFLSAVELFDGMGGSNFNSALIRGVYDEAEFSYELELVLKLGDTFAGANSGLNYLISFMEIADANSVSSGTAWSQNISQSAHLNLPPSFDPVDPRSLGGLVIHANIIYDSDQDSDFTDNCDGLPGNGDQDYNVLLYLGSKAAAIPAPTAEPGEPDKVRFASLVVPDAIAGQDTAIRVQLTTLHDPSNPPPGTPDFSAFEGGFRYVNSFGGSTTCVDNMTFATNYRCGQLGCDPEYRDWAADLSNMTNPPSTSGLIHITGDTMVPSSTLHASIIAASCGAAPGANTCTQASDSLTMITARWGDVAGGGGAPPDGSANVIDIGIVVDNVKGLVTAVRERRAWMKNPTRPDLNPVNVIDIGLTVDAVKGLPYPYTIAACP